MAPGLVWVLLRKCTQVRSVGTAVTAFRSITKLKLALHTHGPLNEPEIAAEGWIFEEVAGS